MPEVDLLLFTPVAMAPPVTSARGGGESTAMLSIPAGCKIRSRVYRGVTPAAASSGRGGGQNGRRAPEPRWMRR